MEKSGKLIFDNCQIPNKCVNLGVVKERKF